MMTNLGSSEEQKNGKKIFSPILVCYSYTLFLTSDLPIFMVSKLKPSNAELRRLPSRQAAAHYSPKIRIISL